MITKASSEGSALFTALGLVLKHLTINSKNYCADKFVLLTRLALPHVKSFFVEHFASIGSYSEEGFSRAVMDFLDLPDDSPFWGMSPESHEAYMQVNAAPGAA